MLNSDAPSKKIKGGNGISSRQRLPGLSISASLKRHHDKQNQSYPGCTNPPSRCSTRPNPSLITKEAGDMVDFGDHEGACFSPRRIFASPPDRSSMQFIADSSEGDVLLDVPSGVVSFPEAELLYDPWEQKTSQIGSPTVSGVEASDLPSSSFANK
ncbi:hypothetical protein BHM03_00031658 [Ensete ventricosum]|nr:hypothetical protein BHM03_00031658 [Ensete ventricosum]